MQDYTTIPAEALRQWQYGAWQCNQTTDLCAITAELKRRGEQSHPFFGNDQEG